MEDMDTRDFFLLDLPSCMSKPSQSQSSVFEPVFEHSQIPKPKSPPSGKQVPSSTRPTLVYSRKKTTIIEPMQVQESKPTTSYEVHNPSSPDISLDYISDLNLPMVVRTVLNTLYIHFPIFCPMIDCYHLIEIFSSA